MIQPRPFTSLLILILLLSTGAPGAMASPVAMGGDGLSPGGSEGVAALSAPRLHTELVSSEPAASDTVAGPVREVRLTFSTPVQAGLSSIRVVTAQGQELAAGSVQHPGQGQDEVILVELAQPLPTGNHEVEWRTVAPDGHVVEGSFTFTVDGAPDQDEPPAAQDPAVEEAPPAPVDGAVEEAVSTLPPGTGQRWLHLLATVLLLGIVGFRHGALRYLGQKGPGPQIRERANGNLVRFAWVASVLLAITLITRIRHQLGELAGPEGTGWEFLPHLLFRTGWGGGWFLHLAAVILAFTALIQIQRQGEEGRGWGILTGVAVLLPLVPAFQGHAMASSLREVAIPILYLHVAGAGIWLGGLLMLILAGLPAVRKVKDAAGGLPPIARLVNGFSRVALAAVALLVLTGMLTSFLQSGGLEAAWGSAWGRTLALKLGLVGAAFLMGFYNWRKVKPTLSSNPDPGQLRIPASVEAVLGLLILLATAVLVALPLP